jgi:hypothetical protein
MDTSKVTNPLPTFSSDLPTPVAPAKKWVLKEMTAKHKQVMALLAQGLGRTEISDIVGITPEYVTMLANQPVCREYLRSLSAFADAQLEAMSGEAVRVIRDVLTNSGNDEHRLKAARLQMEATQRIGTNRRDRSNSEDETERLENMAERLIGLLRSKRVEAAGNVIDVTPETKE